MVEALEQEGLIRKQEPYTHTVPFSHRSGERIEPLISLQWFMRMHELAEPAMEVVRTGQVRFHPERWGRVYLDWLENIRPWCISRQLWWGHRLPVWYCDACEETFVAAQPPERCGVCDGELRRDADVLDTWFSSALWPFATLGWPTDTPELRAFYPTDVLVTARDIIFLWVARMVMMGMEFMHDVPFTDVDITSIIQAPDGRRMSKSLGTGIDPLDEIDAHGADAVRFGLLAMSSSQDVRYSAEKIQQGQQFANKMWNASRLVLLNAADVEPAPRPRTVEDRWILSRLQRAIERWRGQVAAYDLSHAALDLYAFFYGDFCDWYLEMVKPRLYEHEEEVSATALHVLGQTLALAHPMLPFVTEEIHSFMPGARARPRGQPVPRGRRGPAGRGGGARGGVRDRRGAAPAQLPRLGRRGAVSAHPGTARGRSPRRFSGDDRPPRALRHHDGRQRRRGRQLDRARGRDRRGPAQRHGRPGGGTRAHRRRARTAARRDRPRSRQAREQGVHGQGTARSWFRPSGRSSSGSRPSWPNSRARPVELPQKSSSSAMRDAERYLDSLEMFGMRFGLERMRRLMTALDSPHERFRSIHVLGSNGKSSTVRMIAALLRAPRPALRRIPVAASGVMGGARRGRRSTRSPTTAWQRRSPACPRPPRSWIARSARAIASRSSRRSPPRPTGSWPAPGWRWRRSKPASAGVTTRPA